MESESTKTPEENLSVVELSDEKRQLLEEKAEIVRGFLDEREIIERTHDEEKDEMRLAFEGEKENIRRAFECEKEEMRQNFLKEKDNIRMEFQQAKHVLKLSFEDEKAALLTSWEKEKEALLGSFDKEKKEMRLSYDRKLREKEKAYSADKTEMEAKIRKEFERIEEVENELKRTLSQGLGDLENVYFEENAFLESMYNHEQPEVDMHFKGLLDAEQNVDRAELLKSLNQERNRMHSFYTNKHKQVEHEFASEVIDMEQRFKQQKNDLMSIFRREKLELEEAVRKEKEDIKRRFEVEFRRILQQERMKFDAEIQGYEHDISVLKYQKEQLEKCFSLEMQALHLKFGRDRLEMENRFSQEKRDLRRLLKGQYARKLSGDKVRLEWLLDQFHVGKGESNEHLNTTPKTSSEFSD